MVNTLWRKASVIVGCEDRARVAMMHQEDVVPTILAKVIGSDNEDDDLA
jgi:hypothetical protein